MPTTGYLRTEPPAMLTEPFNVAFADVMLEAVNTFRQASHAFYAAPADAPEREHLRALQDEAALRLANRVSGYVRAMHGEPNDWTRS